MAKHKPKTAFATWHPKYGLNLYWVRPRAKDIRDANSKRWEAIKALGWRIVRVNVVRANQ